MDKINENDLVIIAPHVGADCDALASALAMYLIVKKNEKEPVILIDDKTLTMENAVKIILSELPKNLLIMDLSSVKEYVQDKKAMLVTVDTNKENLIPNIPRDMLSDIILIDHHETGEKTINTDFSYIDTSASSASEIMYKLLESFQINFSNKVNALGLDFNIANYLLAGISLDTAKFTKKTTTPVTMRIVGDLMRRGGDLNYVNDLFLDDFEKDKLFLDLVRATTWKMFNIAISFNNEDPGFIYDKEDLAKAADWLMRYKTSDASFVLGLIDEYTTYISGRSRGNVDVGEIMSQFGGGGTAVSGAAKIESNDVLAIKLKLDDVLRPGYKVKGS